jgi:iron-sulfur cluster repair protein YtfE (RIC family)
MFGRRGAGYLMAPATTAVTVKGASNVDAELLGTLESQHRDAEDLLAQLANATEATDQQPLVEKLVAAMSEHMAIEEEQVYPELERIEGELAEEASVEHGLAREGLDKLQSMVGQPGFGAVVEMVKGGISHHVEEEENEAFPKLREALGLADAGNQTKDELYAQAKEAGVEGRSSMTKDELAEAVNEEQGR